MDYIITAYPTMYRRYLVKDVKSIDEAWNKYFEELPEPIDEEFIGDDGDVDIELLTPELRRQYGLGEE